MKPVRAASLVALMIVPLVAFRFGGWAVITVDSLPSHLVAGTPAPLGFTVRQHGVRPLSMLHPTVVMKSARAELTVPATPGRLPGQYTATVTPSAAGEWTIRIISGFMNSENTLLPIRAVPAGGSAPRMLADAETGHQLFFAKGCNTCHMRCDAGGKIGPDLTARRYASAAVATFLADPESSPLSKTIRFGELRMPNLNLSPVEIRALVVYLNSEAVVGSASSR